MSKTCNQSERRKYVSIMQRIMYLSLSCSSDETSSLLLAKRSGIRSPVTTLYACTRGCALARYDLFVITKNKERIMCSNQMPTYQSIIIVLFREEWGITNLNRKQKGITYGKRDMLFFFVQGFFLFGVFMVEDTV